MFWLFLNYKYLLIPQLSAGDFQQQCSEKICTATLFFITCV